MIRDLDLIENINCLFDKKVILYGASGKGMKIYSDYKKSGIHFFAFTDGDEKKWGSEFMELPVISHNDLSEMDSRNEIVIIITSSFDREIEKELAEKGIAINTTYSCFGLEFSVYKHINSGLFELSFVRSYMEKKELWKDVWQLSGHCYNEWLDSIDWGQIRSCYRFGNPVWNFQAGKVASKSLHFYLLERGIPSFHIHSVQCFFKREGLSRDMKSQIQEGIFKNGKVKIVTGIREPISRDISLFFQLMEDGFWYGTDFETKDMKQMCIEFCLDMIQKRKTKQVYNYNWVHYWNEHVKYGAMFDWFDLELKETFGLDVFDYEFDKEKGYQIICKDNVELFLFRMDVLSELNEALGKFLEIDDFVLPHINIGNEKSYYFAYRQMQKEIQLPKKYIEFYYKNNIRMDHFYTEEHKTKMLKKWMEI